ncbi:MAG: cyclic nucleotide-binding domain-containing protein [Nitrospinota bacterium]
MIETPYVERFADGQKILTEGIVSNKAYIVTQGEVRIQKKVEDKNVTVGVLKKGDVFGEMGLFQETKRSATAVAKGDVTVGIIDREHFDKLMEECPDDMKAIISSMIDRLRLTTSKLAALGYQWEKTQRALNVVSVKEELE